MNDYVNPLRDPQDRRLPRVAGPCVLVIFGVTGDLSRKKLMPAVYDLANRGLLPPGFGLVGSAVQNGQRLVMVVNGLKTARDRATEARKLLEWGFRAFEKRQLFAAGETVGEASVYGGEKGRVALKSKNAVSLLLPRGSTERLAARIIYRGPLAVPVQEGAEVARLVVTRGDIKTLDIPLYAAESVQAGTLQSRALDALFE